MDKPSLLNAIEALKTALDGTDTAVIKEKSDALMQASLKLGEAMYKAQGEATQTDSSSAGANTTGNDEKVVDADYEEVK